jgi:hypothetical protein
MSNPIPFRHSPAARCCAFLLLVLAVFRCEAALDPWPGSSTVFQYATDIVTDEATGKSARGYLWIPPNADRIRGVLIGGSVLFEGSFASDPLIREACAKQKLAIVYFSPHLDAMFDVAKSGDKLLAALDSLAAVSGHPELKVAPLMPYGHSVGTIWSRNILFWKPERCFGAIFFKGGFGIPENHSIAEILNIPLIHVQGRFEEFGPGPSGALRPDQGEDRTTGGKTAMAELSKLRAANPAFLMGLFVEDGSTHFAFNPRVAPILAAYIEAAAAARIPDWPATATEPPKLIPVSIESGAFSSSGNLLEAPAFPAAPVADWKGDKTQTFWHATREQAAAADEFHAVARGKKPQFVSAADQKGNPMKVANDMRLKVPPVWVGADTVTAPGAFWTTEVPKNYPAVEGAIEHAPDPVRVRIFSGPLEQIDATTFRVTMDPRWGRPFVLFYHPGDNTFRRSEQPGNLRVPETLKDGTPQTITWPPPGPIKASKLPLTLTATSDSGLPVCFHVDHGPARVVDGRLELADVPKNAQWPLQVEVVAWQYGSAVDPKVASAQPVKQILTIEKP